MVGAEMSLIQEQIEELKEYKRTLKNIPKNWHEMISMEKREIKKLDTILDNAIFIIESMSEKLRASNLNGWWIPCSERMPEENEEVLISCEFGFRLIAVYAGKQEYNKSNC